jgi:hypothetical protein
MWRRLYILTSPLEGRSGSARDPTVNDHARASNASLTGIDQDSAGDAFRSLPNVSRAE